MVHRWEGYTETDGVYYDPNKDVIPAGVVMDNTIIITNVGEDYSYDDNSPSIIEQNQQKYGGFKKINMSRLE